LRSTERSLQPIELRVVSAAESDSEVRALPVGSNSNWYWDALLCGKIA
jgi:hypothetical protein